MTGEAQLVVSRRLGVASAVVALAATLGLAGDHAASRWRGAGEKGRVGRLEASVKEDAQSAAALHAERLQQTDRSLARDRRGRARAWVLLVSAGLRVASAQWHRSLRPQPPPSLEELLAVRFGPPRPARGKAAAPAGAAVASEEAEVDLSFVDGLVERLGRGQEAAVPLLQAIQEHYRYLPDDALRRVCELTEITPAQIAGTSSFYARFRRSPVGRHVVKVCHGTACHVAGVQQIHDELRRHLGISPGADTDARRLFTLEAVACLGCCSLAPILMVGDETAGRLTPASARQAL
ncbi:MAG TPA: NAD(P)H-dependent oxidoreductase subunit E, partial [Vicinamibacteria bacterium]